MDDSGNKKPTFLSVALKRIRKYVNLLTAKCKKAYRRIHASVNPRLKIFIKRLDNYFHRLKYISKLGWFRWTAAILLFSIFFNFFLYSTRPSAINQQVQLQKLALSQQLDIIQNIRSPQEWEFGQKDTANSSQFQDLIFITEEYSAINNGQLNNWQSTIHFGDLTYGYDISGKYKTAKYDSGKISKLGDDIITTHLSLLLGAQDFIEFNCEAYLIYQNSPSQELQSLLDQTDEALATINNEAYQQALGVFSEEINSFRSTLNSTVQPEVQNQACKQAQTTLRVEAGKALSDAQESFTSKTQDLAFTLSEIQLKLAQ